MGHEKTSEIQDDVPESNPEIVIERNGTNREWEDIHGTTIVMTERKKIVIDKCYELSHSTGSQLMVILRDESGYVYTITTKRFQPFLNTDNGKEMLKTMLANAIQNTQN